MMVPALWITYGLVFWRLGWDGPSIGLTLLCLPLFSYVAIVVADAGMVDIQDLRPYFMRLVVPSTRRRWQALPSIRKVLADDLRRTIRTIGPSLGDLYFEKEVDWTVVQENMKKLGNVSSSTKKEE